MLSATAKLTYSPDKTLAATEHTDGQISVLSSTAFPAALKPTKYKQQTNKPSDKMNRFMNLRKPYTQMYLNNAKRHSQTDEQLEIKLLSTELAEFICHRLPDPCARAAYLRQHVRHDMCFRLPLLYLLPHTDFRLDKPYLSEYKSGTCKGSLSRLTYLPSDSSFEQFLTPASACEHSLLSLKKIMDDKLRSHFGPYDSRPNVTGECQCQECQEAYKNWFCATEFPLYYPLDDLDLNIPSLRKSIGSGVNLHQPHVKTSDRFENSKLSTLQINDPIPLNRSSSSLSVPSSIQLTSENVGTYQHSTPTEFHTVSYPVFRLEIVQPCISWCTQVETVCPYLNPADSTSNGGEPAFLCDESHYHHSSRYQAVYRDMNTCESECCFGISDSNLLSVSIPERRQYPFLSDILLSYTSNSNDELNNHNQSCSQLRDRCLHRLLSLESSLIPEYPDILDQTSTVWNYNVNISRNDSMNNLSPSSLFHQSSSSVIVKINNISFGIILIISLTFYCFIWLNNIQDLIDTCRLFPVWHYIYRLMTTTASVDIIKNKQHIRMHTCILLESLKQYRCEISPIIMISYFLIDYSTLSYNLLYYYYYYYFLYSYSCRTC
ncbi:unnamed protein product [Heterobilharzia americana]|nr:unnamed protein product [Heterobilharzia americana]